MRARAQHPSSLKAQKCNLETHLGSDEQAAQVKEIMENGVPLKVPSKIDQELKDNWGEIE